MSQQVSYGTITIVDTNDIESIIVEYNRNQSTSSPPAQSDSGWSTNRPAWAQGYYIWQRTRTHKSGTATTEDEFGTAVCITGSTGSTGSTGQSLTSTKTQYTNVAANVTITTNNHTSYTWTDNVPSYSASAPVYWGRITNTYSNPSDTKYIVYKDNGLTDAIAKSVEANANAAAANSNATEALNKAKNSIVSTVQLWYQTSSNTKPAVPTAHSQVDNGTNTYNNWRSTRPTNNVSTYPYYYYCYEYKHGDNTYTYSNEAILDTSNLSQYQIEALDTKLKAFFYPGDSNNPGAYAVAKGESDGLDVTDISTYGYNVGIRPTNIAIGYNNTPVIQLDGSTGAIKLYRFPTISQGAVTQAGTLGMSLGTSNLIFYKPDGSTQSAILNTNGLKISQGGLEAGTFNTDDYVYAWSTNRSDRSLAINDSGNKTDWRFLAGKKFGVDKAGNLYASNVNVSGKITVNQGSNVYTTDNVNPLQIGGRNLLLATPKDYNATAYRIYQLPLSENLIVGETYTLQFWGVSLDSNSTGLRPFWGGGNNVLTPLTKPNSSGYWAQTFTVGTPSSSTEAANKWLAIYNAPSGHTGANGSISKWKLEKGNKATDWTPAPEDTINDNLVRGSQKMDGWKRNSNASLDTSSEFGDVTLTGSSSNWLGGILTAPTMRTSILDGSALWLSLEYKASVASTLHIEFSGTSANPDTSPGSQTKYRTWNYSVASTSSWTKLAYPMPTLLSELTGGSGDVNSLFVAFYNRTDNSTMHIRKVKLEHGIAPTEWTPSPEDFKTYITRIDDAGIRIHPSSTEDDSVVISSDAISMYRNNKQMMKLDDSTLTFYNNSGGVVATYGSSITLASNEASVTIGNTSKYHTVLTNSGMYFRNGANTTSTNLLTITGNKITLYKPNTTTAAATLDANGLSIAAGSITLGSNFSVTAAGVLTATSGTIGGWGISSSQIYHYADSSGGTATATTAKYYLYIQSTAGSNGGNYAFAIRTRTDDEVTANSPTIGSATVQFGVSWTGYMVAKNANITGTIVATSFTAKDSNNKTRAVVNTNGLNIYDTDGTTSVALFSATPRIGKSGSQRIEANSAGIEIYDTGNQRRLLLDASTGLIIGRSDKQHIIINDANVDIYNNASTPTLSARLNTDGLTMYRGGSKRAATTANGLDIFGSDGSTSIASFGNTIRLGKTTQSYLNIYTKGTDGIEGVIDFYKGSTLIGSIESTYTSSTSTINLTARHGSNIGTFSVGPTGANLWFGAPGNPPIDFGSTGTISANSYIESSNSNGSVRLVVDSGHRGIYDAGNSQWIIYGGTSNYIYVNNNFGPGTTSTSTSTGFYLGWSNYRWRGVYSYSAPNSVSDKKDKDIIGSINYAKELIMKLKPIEYQWKNSDHNRIHLGLIAQDVAKIGKELNKNLSIYEANYKNSEQKYHGEEVDDNELSWGMTYTELIAPMIKVIQEQEQRIQKLESIIKGGNVDVSD